MEGEMRSECNMDENPLFVLHRVCPTTKRDSMRSTTYGVAVIVLRRKSLLRGSSITVPGGLEQDYY
jgi:hypothetical protein